MKIIEGNNGIAMRMTWKKKEARNSGEIASNNPFSARKGKVVIFRGGTREHSGK